MPPHVTAMDEMEEPSLPTKVETAKHVVTSHKLAPYVEMLNLKEFAELEPAQKDSWMRANWLAAGEMGKSKMLEAIIRTLKDKEEQCTPSDTMVEMLAAAMDGTEEPSLPTKMVDIFSIESADLAEYEESLGNKVLATVMDDDDGVVFLECGEQTKPDSLHPAMQEDSERSGANENSAAAAAKKKIETAEMLPLASAMAEPKEPSLLTSNSKIRPTAGELIAGASRGPASDRGAEDGKCALVHMEPMSPHTPTAAGRDTALGLCHFLVDAHSALSAERFATLTSWLREHQAANPAVWGLPVFSTANAPLSAGQLPRSQITPPSKSVHNTAATAANSKRAPPRRTGRQRGGVVRLGDGDGWGSAISTQWVTDGAGLADALGFDDYIAGHVAADDESARGRKRPRGAAADFEARSPLVPIQAAKRGRPSAVDGFDLLSPSVEAGASLLLALSS